MPAEILFGPYRRSSRGDGVADAALNDDWRGRRVVVMGLGRFGGGIGAARWLAEQGARVVVTDQAGADSLADSTRLLADLDIEFQLGGHDARLLNDAEAMVVSPAVNQSASSFFTEATARGIAWTTEIHLFLHRCRARVVGVTGSAGKSTTCGMIGECLKDWNGVRRSFVGGNWGGSLLGELKDMTDEDVVVLELSSFQLSGLPRISRRPDVAVITNVWPQHLDRHGTFEAYFDAKLNMLRNVKRATPVVLGFDDPGLVKQVRTVATEFGASVVDLSELLIVDALNIPGRHNVTNARCAAAACSLLGMDDAIIRHRLASFRGLPHRMEVVGTWGGVTYINDSKATSPRAAVVGLKSLDAKVVALIGGRAKGDDLAELVSALEDRCPLVLCFGSGGKLVFDTMVKESGEADRCQHFSTMCDAIAAARTVAKPGDIVLLSPGFDSYDEFVNFEHRGQAFISVLKTNNSDSPAG